MMSQILYCCTLKGALSLICELLCYLTRLNFKIFDRSSNVPLIISCFFLELGILSYHLFNGKFPIGLFGCLLLILLLLWKILLLLLILLWLVFILNGTMLLKIPLLVCP